MASKKIPHLVFADAKGNIYDHPHLLMLVRKGQQWTLPRPDELIELPLESTFYLLPQRKAIGLDPDTGAIEVLDELAIAAFVAPGYTLTGHAAYVEADNPPALPLFAYGAVGYLHGKFWVSALQVDQDKRQVFTGIKQAQIVKGLKQLLQKFPQNRLLSHLSNCALTYNCPAAKNLALGRFEAPLPTAQTCNARCVGCISYQPNTSGFCATQNRITFTPSPQEIAEVMSIHAQRAKNPIYSFGQGCEGEPLTGWKNILKSIQLFRQQHGKGTININTNASFPQAIEPLAKAGLNSIRVSLNSARKTIYKTYYRPKYKFKQVIESILEAKKNSLFVSLNYLYFPGLSDTEQEITALIDLISDTKLDFIQLRNLNLDPQIYLNLYPDETSPCFGLKNFMTRIKKACPWINFGYFNPYLGD
ncbi:MAG: radical SAM protein [Desulfonauticus sp.]|nr:radical SAM protein [Desulfonauticus sp.]